MKKLKAIEVGRFKDGGTKKVLTEDGHEYFIDYRISSRRLGIQGGVYDRHPNLKGAKKLDIEIELVDRTHLSAFLKKKKDIHL